MTMKEYYSTIIIEHIVNIGKVNDKGELVAFIVDEKVCKAMKLDEFVQEHCTACGGNWTRMLMTGIKEKFPDTWDTMEDRTYELSEIIEILKRLGIDVT